MEDSRTDESSVSTGLHGTAKVPANKAYRAALGSALITKAAGEPTGMDELFGAVAAPKRTPKPKAKKELTYEEELKKTYEKNTTANLVFQTLNLSLFFVQILGLESWQTNASRLQLLWWKQGLPTSRQLIVYDFLNASNLICSVDNCRLPSPTLAT